MIVGILTAFGALLFPVFGALHLVVMAIIVG
jgi:hypothetical protein